MACRLVEMLRALLTPILGGILLAWCFLPAPAHWLAWISLTPVAAAIASRRRLIATCIGMYCAGLIFNLITTDWIRTLDSGTGLTGSSAPDWLFQSQLLALFWPIALLLGRAIVATWAVPMSIVLPAVWTIHEALLRTVWALVDQTGWRIYFLGYAIVDHGFFSQIADLGGVSALTFLAACTSGAVWDLWSIRSSDDRSVQLRLSRLAGVGIGVSVLVSCAAYGGWRLEQTHYTRGPNVWLMPDEALERPPEQLPWTPQTSSAPDVLLWSELAYHGPRADASPSANKTPPGDPATLTGATAGPRDRHRMTRDEALEQICNRFAVPIVVGYRRTASDSPSSASYNAAAFVDPVGGMQGTYDKIGLVPWTEFTPRETLTARKSAGFSRGKAYPVFTLSTDSAERAYRFSTAICYDIAFADLFRRFMQDSEGAPDFFLVCSSERSDKTGRMSRHVLSIAKVRAIECRRTLVRNVRGGPSGRIDSTGRLRDPSLPPLIETATPLGSIAIDARSTLFVKWGDWIPAAVVWILLVAAALKLISFALARRER